MVVFGGVLFLKECRNCENLLPMAVSLAAEVGEVALEKRLVHP